MKLLKVLSSVVLSTTLLFSAQTAQAHKLTDIKESAALKVAIPQYFPSFDYIGTDLQSKGYEIDMAQYSLFFYFN